MAWEQFRKVSLARSNKMGDDIVSISMKSNIISIPSKMCGNAKTVEVFFDKAYSQMGFVFKNESTSGFTLISMPRSTRRKYIFSKGLIKKIQETVRIRDLRFTRIAVKENEMWIINL
jgi:hypothetical protein